MTVHVTCPFPCLFFPNHCGEEENPYSLVTFSITQTVLQPWMVNKGTMDEFCGCVWLELERKPRPCIGPGSYHLNSDFIVVTIHVYSSRPKKPEGVKRDAATSLNKRVVCGLLVCIPSQCPTSPPFSGICHSLRDSLRDFFFVPWGPIFNTLSRKHGWSY